MTRSPKLKRLIEKYSLPDDATEEEVLRALDVHCTDSEIDRSELYSRRCQASTEPEEVNEGYD